MGTYTTNYNLFMPSIGEQGWGEIVNNNFSTIDTTMEGLSNRATALENADTAFDARLQPFEEHISFDSDGNIVGNVIGNVTGHVISTYTVTFSSIYVVSNAGTGRYKGGVSIMYLQPSPSVTYSCPSTLSVQANRNDTIYGMDGVTVTVYTYNGVDWSNYSSNSIDSYGGTLSLSFPTSTKGVFIEVSGGGNHTFKFPLPIIK